MGEAERGGVTPGRAAMAGAPRLVADAALLRVELRRDAAGAYSVAMSQNRPPAEPRRVTAALLAVLAAALSCDGPAEPGTPAGAPSIAVTVSPSRADVPFGYVATVQVAGDSLQPSVDLLVRGRQIAIPISGPGTYTYEDTLRTPTTDTLRFRIESENGRTDSTTAIVTGTNTPPSITAKSLSEDSVMLGDSALVRVVATDTKPGFTTRVSLGTRSSSHTATAPADTAMLWAMPTIGGTQYAIVSVTDSCGASTRDSLPVRSFVNPAALTITSAEMRDWIARLSDDSLRGRLTPSPELDKAALAIAARFQQLGLGGPFGGSYIQRYPVPASDSAPNVGGLLEGSDQQLKAEVVVVAAHFDHAGTAGSIAYCFAVGGDSICNGANDNASGTAAVLELAKAFAGITPRPLRSVLFLAVSGEEEDWWGSTYFADHPPMPLANVVAVLDIDMIGRNSMDSILVGGLANSTLGDRASVIAQAHPEERLRLTPLESGVSDDAPFASRGIPSLAFFNDIHADWHRASDTVDLVNAELAARTARIVFYTALDVSNAPNRPQLHAGRQPAQASPLSP